MCGIVGVFGACSSSLLNKMLSMLHHRGPDYSSSASMADVHLAHARLSIIDLSSNSNQPLWDINKRGCIVFNGEIYNFKQLRSMLVSLGYVFQSGGDAEVILNLYLHFGVQCLSYLQGIFSFAIWDVEEEELFIARDQFGVKPLYYVENEKGFFFSSEIKALLVHPYVSRELNVDAIFRTIVFLWSPGPETILKEVLKLEPGSYLRVKNRRVVEHKQYYEWPQYQPKNLKVSEWCQRLDEALSDSVRDQLVSDVPVGAFLSGGLDSSLIVALAKKAGIDAECFTMNSDEVSLNEEGFVDDLPYAKCVAEKLNVPLNIVSIKNDAVCLLEKMLYHLDEPQADPAPLNVLLICKAAREKGIKVLFSGAGGDDLFTGYRRHVAIQYEKYWAWLPLFMRRFLQTAGRVLNKRRPLSRRLSKMFYYAGLSNNERLLSYFYWIDPVDARNLFVDNVQKKLKSQPMSALLSKLEALKTESPLEKMLYIERRYFLVDHNFNYTDKMAMAYGVEVRVPFLDHRVAECAANINSSIKQKRSAGKWILKKMAESYLPLSVIYRPKSGFGGPLKKWLNEDMKAMVDEVLSVESLQRRGLFDSEAVRTLLRKEASGEEYYTYPIFALICIELWCRIFIDQIPVYALVEQDLNMECDLT